MTRRMRRVASRHHGRRQPLHSSDDEESYEKSITSVGFGMTAADGQRQRVSFTLGGGSSSSPLLESVPKHSRADAGCADPPPLHVVCRATGWERMTVQVAAESQCVRQAQGTRTYLGHCNATQPAKSVVYISYPRRNPSSSAFVIGKGMCITSSSSLLNGWWW